MTQLEQRLGVAFRDKALALRALTHKSAAEGARSIDDNQRLEFLGDAVLQLAISHLLYLLPGELPEGDLTRFRAHLVNAEALAFVADSLELRDIVRVGRGLQTDSSSVTADCVEALLGALFLDQSFAVVQRVVERLLGPRLQRALTAGPPPCDAKSRLQQFTLARWNVLPRYTLVDCTGDNPPRFQVSVQVGQVEGLGSGTSKKSAEQSAAHHMLSLLETSHDDE